MMRRDERLRWLAQQLTEVAEEEKAVKKNRSDLREEFFRLLDHEQRGQEHLLPVITVEIPHDFFQNTGLSKEDFARTRFPDWDVEHVEHNIATGMLVFVFRKNPHFVPRSVEIEDSQGTVRVSKDVAEYSPEIDWETLQKDRPDLYQKLAVPVVSHELNERALEQLINETPEEVATLQRHMTVKQSSLRATPRRVKDGREG